MENVKRLHKLFISPVTVIRYMLQMCEYNRLSLLCIYFVSVLCGCKSGLLFLHLVYLIFNLCMPKRAFQKIFAYGVHVFFFSTSSENVFAMSMNLFSIAV